MADNPAFPSEYPPIVQHGGGSKIASTIKPARQRDEASFFEPIHLSERRSTGDQDITTLKTNRGVRELETRSAHRGNRLERLRTGIVQLRTRKEAMPVTGIRATCHEDGPVPKKNCGVFIACRGKKGCPQR